MPAESRGSRWAGGWALLLLLAAAAPRPIAAAEQQCSSGITEQSAEAFTPRPKACVTDEQNQNMGNVRDVIQMLGYELTDRPVEANLIWTWRDPFSIAIIPPEEAALLAAHTLLKSGLGNQQYINQLPGSGFLTTKTELATLSSRRGFHFLPRTFKLPQEYEAWQAFIKTERGSKMEWVQKFTDHRGVSIIPDPSASAWGEVKQKVLVQQLVRPLLISNRLWEIGVYVAITQLEPLTAYVFTGGAYIRFCSKEYERNITLDTDKSTYVIHGIDNILAAQEVPELAPFFADAGSDTVMGSTLGLAAVTGYLGSPSVGLNTTAWWLDVQAVIVQTLADVTDKMAMTQKYYFAGARTNFFTLLRFDMMLGEDRQMHLIEVNMSPGLLRPVPARDHQLLSRRLVHDLLTLKGLAPGGHLHPFTSPELAALKYNPDAVKLGEPLCGGGCGTAEACGSKPACLLCRACRSEWQNGVLSRLMAEQQNSGAFMRVFPPGKELSQHLKDNKVMSAMVVEQRPDDVLVRTWLEAKCRTDFRYC